MIASLRESKTRLSELVALANAGEEVLITIHGRPKARLVPIAEGFDTSGGWLRELSKLRASLRKKPVRRQSTALDEVREDRW